MAKYTGPAPYPGQQFGRWTVIGGLVAIASRTFAPCRCNCGTERRVQTYNLRSGASQSCGCLATEVWNRALTHGEARAGRRTPEYRIWTVIKSRCFNPNTQSFRYYGARGIVMSPLWVNDFLAFLSHVGRRPSPLHSIDRINNDGNYEPGNVRWVTIKEQNRNTRANKYLTFNGETKTVAEWSRVIGIRAGRLYSRLNSQGWSVEDTLTTPAGRAARPVAAWRVTARERAEAEG